MVKSLLTAAALALLPLPVLAGGLDTVVDPVVMAPAPAPAPRLIFKLRGGVSAAPAYFGSRDVKVGPDFGFNLEFARLGGQSIGSADPNAIRYGFAPRGSFRLIGKRSASDHAELAGLEDVDLSVEVGFGLGYTQRNFEAYGDIRYGAIGHHAWVGELGANLVMHPSDQLTLRVGPRLFAGTSDYANTYFGVTAAEAAASGGNFTAFDAKGGVLSAGVELGATYDINDKWGVDGAIRWDKYRGSAENSPIVQQGRDNSLSLRLGLTRRFSLNF